MRRPLIAGNWKMHKTMTETRELIEGVFRRLNETLQADVVVAPPFTALVEAKHCLRNTPLKLAAQNMHHEPSGAYTGEISAQMLVDAGCHYVILGHSERRIHFGESDDLLNKKIRSAWAAGLKVIFCIGETESEREGDQTETVLARQLESGLSDNSLSSHSDLVIAYEPVWAIGTGKNASPAMAQAAHRFIRDKLVSILGEAISQEIRILYGGSVKPENSADLLALEDVDGLLVGGASLVADSFCDIIDSVR